MTDQPIEDPKKPKLVSVEDLLGNPEFMVSMPPEVREYMSRIKLDVRVDMGFTETPYHRVSLLERLALASCEPADAAYAIYLLAWEAAGGVYRHVGRDGQEKILRWVLASYFEELPPDLWPTLELYLEPSESTEPPPTQS
jgi:hypothetical protein